MAASRPDSFNFSHGSLSCLPVPACTMSLQSRRAEHPTGTLTLPQLDRYHDRAEGALAETIAAYGDLDGSVDTARWKALKSRHGVQLFRGRQLTTEGHTPLLCVGTLRGHFDDALEGLYCDNTEDMVLMNAIKCPRLAESAVLYTVQQKSTLKPYAFTGIKWATIKLSVASNRDVCYFDKMGLVRQTSGKRMAYHVMQSVDLPEHPHKSKHKRVRLSLCYVLEELEDDLVGVYMQGEVSYTALSWFATSAISDVVLATANAMECARAKKLALVMTANRPGAWRCNSSRKNCFTCKGSSSFFESLNNCAGCNKHMCKKCRFREHVLARDSVSRDHLKRAEFCCVCISKTNLSSLDQIRIEAGGYSVPESAANTTFCKIEEDTEDVIQDSNRSLTSFVRKITAQMQELSSRGVNRASSLSSMGKASEDNEGEDVLNSSRLISDQFVIIEKDLSRPSPSSTRSTTSSSYGRDENDPESFHASLFAKLQQVLNQAEETLVFAREQSLVAHSVRARSRRTTASSEGSGYTSQ
ncbi:hypothetical protein PRIC2_014229 [Phytophthora ramorum]